MNLCMASNVLMLATTSYYSVFKVGAYHIANELVKKGYRVTYLPAPISIPAFVKGLINKNTRNRWKSGKEFKDKLHVNFAVNLLPLHKNIYFKTFSKPFIIGVQQEEYDLALVDSFEWLPYLSSFNVKKIIYRPTDVYSRAFSVAKHIETKYVKEKNIEIICTGANSTDYYKNQGFNVVFSSENGVSEAFLKNRRNHPELPGSARKLSCVYVGAIDDRFDLDWVISMSYKLPDVNFDIYGPNEQKLPKKIQNNLHFLGEIDYQKVPEILTRYDFGLLPFNKNKKNLSRSPMKLYEYLSCGLSVLTTENILHNDYAHVIRRDVDIQEENFRNILQIDRERRDQIQEKLSTMAWEKIVDQIVQVTL